MSDAVQPSNPSGKPPRSWPQGAPEKWPEGRFASDGSGVTCSICSRRDGKDFFVTTYHLYALHHWQRHLATNRHQKAVMNAAKEKDKVKERPRFTCDGVIPRPDRMETLSKTLLYQKYSVVADSSSYQLGTTELGFPTIFSKSCNGIGVKRKFGHVCDSCYDFRSEKYRELKKTFRKAAKKYTDALVLLREPFVSPAKLESLHSITMTPSRYLSQEGCQLKEACQKAVDRFTKESKKSVEATEEVVTEV